MRNFRILLFLLVILFTACKKEKEVVTFTNNTIPDYAEVPTILVENYVNRLFIDLIGREPTDAEMDTEVAALEAGDLTLSARNSLVDKIMTSTTFIVGDTSYAQAYSQKYYDDNKSRFLDGMSEADVVYQYLLYKGIAYQDSLNGSMIAYELNKQVSEQVKSVILSRTQFQEGQISAQEMCRRMCRNVMYDDLHMGSFNFINATFDDLFFRFPTEHELDEAFEPIEQVPDDDLDLSGYLFGHLFSDKVQYLEVLTSTEEFSEGMIRWAYLGLMAREPSSAEIYTQMNTLGSNYNIRAVQKSILTTDEYAGFD
jgi:hypothetical protein